MSTALTINKIQMAPMDQEKNEPATPTSQSPINFTLEGVFAETNSTQKPVAFKAVVSSGVKLPGGSELLFIPIRKGKKDLLDQGNVVVFRLFDITVPPKIVQVRVIDHGYGTRNLSVLMIIPAKKATEEDTKKDQDPNARIFCLTNPPVDLSMTTGAQIHAEPCPNDGDVVLHFILNWPLPAPQD